MIKDKNNKGPQIKTQILDYFNKKNDDWYTSIGYGEIILSVKDSKIVLVKRLETEQVN
ncbi:hypothetical protein [Clostridium cochlearium]|uniref:hypothetical protein n=1 Tax=Clostridium cochlearium TaxID=1494 RepID=UPI00241D7864|nr:hypothetical protein [Clostridium cochlearium]